MKKYLNEYKYLIVLILLAIFSHIEWFNFKSILFNYDFQLRTNELLQGYLSGGRDTWIWGFGFGSQNIQMSGWLHTFFWGLIGDYSIATKLNLFIPVALLGVTTSYFLIRYLTKNNYASFVGALIYGFNTYILVKHLDHITIAFAYSLFPLIFLFFHKIINERENLNKNIIIFSLLYTVSIVYEIRITFLSSLILLLYFIFNLSKNNFISIVKAGVVILFLNLYWLLPVGVFDKGDISNLANRGLFGNELFNLMNAISLHTWHRTGGYIPWSFEKNDPPMYFFMLPLILFIGVLRIFNINNHIKKDYIFYLLLFLIGVTFSKQSSEPFTSFYSFFYDNIPGFNLFREASKFYLVPAFSISVLVGYYLSIERNILFLRVFSIPLILLFVFNLKPFILKEAGDILKNQKIPDNYVYLNELIKSDTDKFKTLWVPYYSHLGYNDIDKPKMSLWWLLNKDYSGTPYYLDFTDLNTGISNFKNPELYFSIINNQKLMEISGVKYIIIPAGYKEETGGDVNFPNNIFPYAGVREEYIEKLDSISYLKKFHSDELGGIALYKVTGFNSLVFDSDSIFNSSQSLSGQLINNIDYKRTFRSGISIYYNISNDKIINFSQTKNKNWILEFNGLKFNKVKSLDFLNSWTISKNEIMNYVSENYGKELQSQGYPKLLSDGKLDYKYYTLNTDGSIDVELTLYFKPQLYFYIGLAISSITFLSLLLYLGYDFARNRRKNQTI